MCVCTYVWSRFFFFFFSSRRRHTRCSRDWSSDVCSSDLLSYLALFYVPINQIHSVNHLLQHALAASERVFDVLDTTPEVQDRPGAARPAERLHGAVRFDRVSFHYRSDVPILTGVSLDVSPGERIALVGPSGAGKSTMLKLLMRFYDVQGGAITIDGRSEERRVGKEC